MTETFRIAKGERRVVEADIHIVEDDWEFHEYLTATWMPRRDEDSGGGNYWSISGDNCGYGDLIVHSYQLPALKALITRLEEIDPS